MEKIMLFGLTYAFIGMLCFVGLVTYITFMSSSSIGSGVIFVTILASAYFFDYLSLTEIFVYSGVFLTAAVAWATFRLIRGARADYDERIDNNKRMSHEESDKEALGTILDRVSFSLFGYRVFFMPIDVVDYIISDFIKEIFVVIKKRVRVYLFKSILGETE